MFSCFKKDINDVNTKKIDYFKSGTIQKIYIVNKENLLNGEYIEYRENGKLWVHCYYKNEALVGLYKQYDEEGNLWHFYDYDNKKSK
jgi:antitoxin component YwqK of YwqJK toxin-antitoxin module